MLARAREQRLGVGVELLRRVGKVDERHRGEHHALVARHEVVQELAALLALLLHVVGHGHVIVHVGVLPARPVGDVRLHTEQSPLHLAHRLVSGHGDDVYGKRHRAPRVGKLGQKAVLDVGRVVGQVQGARPAAAHPQAVGLNARALGRNGVLERVPPAHRGAHVDGQVVGAAPVEAPQKPQLALCVELLAVRPEAREVRGRLRRRAVEVGADLLDASPSHGDGKVYLAHHGIRPRGLLHEHGVVLLAVAVEPVALGRYEDAPPEGFGVEPAHRHGDLGPRVGVERVEQVRVAQEHGLLILL